MSDDHLHESPDSMAATPDEYLDSNPVSPGSVDESSEASTPLDPPSSNSDATQSGTPSPASAPNADLPRRVPSLRTVSDPQGSTHLSPSSSLSGVLNHARRPPPSAGSLPLDVMQRARALQQQRMGMAPTRPPLSTPSTGSSLGSPMSGASSPMGPMGALPGGVPTGLQLPGGLTRPLAHGFPNSAPVVPSMGGRRPGPSLSERRQMKLGGMTGPSATPPPGRPKLSDMAAGGLGGQGSDRSVKGMGSRMSDFKKYIDAEKGWITFDGAATITRTGVNFANGQTFKISLDEVDVLDELGKGNYGTVFKVRHARPRKPRFGPGLTGFKSASRQSSASEKDDESVDASPLSPAPRPVDAATTGVVMAMKELRLELDEAKFTTILKELVILHECVSPFIIDFYGAFFQEGAVYICIEYMDGGSIDKLYQGGIPEPVLRKITYATIMGLKTLKDDHNIIHRDVKPTNILANTRGQVKICDFGVSGNLVASIAKTNIGCQSYMAPERISGGGSMSAAGTNADGSYSVQSDIWSLGLTIIECAMGRYPYPPEVSSTIFSQLSAIVEGEPPDLPSEGYSATARDFVRSCLNKNPTKRHTYSMLLNHPWIKPLTKPATIAEDIEAEDDAENDALADAAGRLDLGQGLGHTGDGTTEIFDAEVAAWARGALERKRTEGAGGGGGASGAATVAGGAGGVGKPALHAAPLDTVSPVARTVG